MTESPAHPCVTTNPARTLLDNAARLDALQRLGLFGSPAEEGFDRPARLARQFLKVPMALVSLVGSDRQYFKAMIGFDEGVQREQPLDCSFCQHVVTARAPLMINDARQDPNLCNSAAVTRLGMVAYLGFPLRTPDGFILGALCAVDRQPRTWEPPEVELIGELAQLVMTEIASRYRNLGVEHELRESKERLRQVLGWADCIVWEAEVEISGEKWDWKCAMQPSGLFHRLFGERVPEQNVGLWYRFAVPEQTEMDQRCREALLTGKPGYTQEFRAIRDGGTTWLRETVTISQLGPNRFWLVGVATDITSLREAEAARRTSEQQVRLFVEHAPASVAMLDREMRYLVVSRQWLRDYDLEGREIIGRSHEDVLPELSGEWRTVYERCLEGAVERGESTPLVRSDGSTRWLHWEVRPWHGADGLVGGLMIFTQDVTERKALDDSLAQARDQALEASRLKSEFMATMSHEIRTPMNAILGMGELLAGTSLQPEQASMLQTMRSGAQNLMAIIDDILDFSRIEAGRMRLDVADFDFRAVVQETVSLLTPRAAEKGLRLISDVTLAPDGLLRGDNGRVRQILTNLIGNAVKFTDAGEVAVIVRTFEESSERVKTRVEVRDTGVGITPAVQKKLFQPFVQADASSTRRFGGTGLGLAISRQLVEMMGGHIGMESVPGRGSTFWFELPLVRSGKRPGATEFTAPAPRSGRALRLLVVEDEGTNQQVVSLLLRQLGHNAAIATNGAEALRLLASGNFDAVLMDCQMPVMDGYEATQRIRAGQGGVNARIPIIALTAYARPEDRTRCLAAGMNAYVSKPLRMADLAAALAKVCGT